MSALGKIFCYRCYYDSAIGSCGRLKLVMEEEGEKV